MGKISLFISDTHWGNPSADIEKKIDISSFILGKIDIIESIYLVGDIYDTWYDKEFPELVQRDQKRLFSYVEKTKQKYYLFGNHDYDAKNYLDIYGFIVKERELFRDGIVIHGHQFDSTTRDYIANQKFALKYAYKLSKLFKLDKVFFNPNKYSLADKILSSKGLYNVYKRAVMEYASKEKVKYVIVGHSHTPEIEKAREDGKLIYINIGDSMQHSTFGIYEHLRNVFGIYDYKKKIYLYETIL